MMVNTDKSNYTSINAIDNTPIEIYNKILNKKKSLKPNNQNKTEKTLGYKIETDLK